ncbi:respiratory-chain NADH dehydrogenase, 30 Kd subunit [Geobacillus kaustophilus]|uniref:Respiratory-chain NADH dehydrogenase, 30 Kd subunit n=1 Tax=Geobacillus kaustophilus TaxID=1462 RepID=A0A0D8BQ05_GEOKU|nr:NADH-quinone oxidoreductase subunit C [Geobacillus kaustophilus]KJE26288.1 respiratory-chain NADH dehydrogenase, 30 Kd subunit [Geobacillus kaustophilus]
MGEEKDLTQRKKEAAERAKQLARERLAARQADEQAKSAAETGRLNSHPNSNDRQIETMKGEAAKSASTDDLALAKKRAAEEARARAAELRRQRESAATGDDLEAAKRKAAEEARAKAAELRRQREAAAAGGGAEDDLELAKKKAAAAAKARAAALAKQKAAEALGGTDELAKQKAAAAAKAKAAAAAKARAAALAKQQGGADDEGAKQKAAAAARAKAEETDGGTGRSAAPSPNDPLLEKYVRVIHEHLGPDVLEDAYINRLAKDMPTLVVKKEAYYKVAEFLKYNEQLRFDYLSELHGTDFQTHMEVYVHLYSYPNRQPVALKVKIERDNPEIDSLVPLWPGANWPECEAYDLLGIRFRGHPNLIRIFLGEQWVGHPLRKDYEPYDAEV